LKRAIFFEFSLFKQNPLFNIRQILRQRNRSSSILKIACTTTSSSRRSHFSLKGAWTFPKLHWRERNLRITALLK
jgi:hypothetical protein